MSHKWNHQVCALWSLASLVQHRIFHWCVALHYMDEPQCVLPSWRRFGMVFELWWIEAPWEFAFKCVSEQMFSFPLCKYLHVESLNCTVSMWHSKKLRKCFPKVVIPFCLPTSSASELRCSHPHPHFILSGLVDLGIFFGILVSWFFLWGAILGLLSHFNV
jgi:hypothetical protein